MKNYHPLLGDIPCVMGKQQALLKGIGVKFNKVHAQCSEGGEESGNGREFQEGCTAQSFKAMR